jgi:hypothetical protein
VQKYRRYLNTRFRLIRPTDRRSKVREILDRDEVEADVIYVDVRKQLPSWSYMSQLATKLPVAEKKSLIEIKLITSLPRIAQWEPSALFSPQLCVDRDIVCMNGKNINLIALRYL